MKYRIKTYCHLRTGIWIYKVEMHIFWCFWKLIDIFKTREEAEIYIKQREKEYENR
jgi:hypothetical protein